MAVIGVPVRYDYLADSNNRSVIYIFDSVRRSIQKAGGDVFLIVPIQDVDYMITKYEDLKELTNEEKIRVNKVLDKCDGLFFPGGIKFTPYDKYILEYAIDKDIPTLGVCLSMQMMSCYKEDIVLEKIESNINHYDLENDLVHSVKIDKNSKLYKILGKDEIMVNSIHHYHSTDNHIYKVVARAEDGIIEAIEHPTATFNIGLQWHPEKNYDTNKYSKLIIDEFIKQATEFSKKKKKTATLV